MVLNTFPSRMEKRLEAELRRGFMVGLDKKLEPRPAMSPL